jgi:integrase
MSRARDRLSAVAVRGAAKPGFYHDGGGLYLQVSRFGTKSWILRYTINKKTRDMGLGPLSDWTLAEARERAKKYRQLIDDKNDPIEFRQAEQKARAEEMSSRKTFEQCAIECHSDNLTGWKNAKHAAQWISTLTRYAFPFVGSLNVAAIGKKEVANILRPIWLEKPETANRLLQRVRLVLEWASAHECYPSYDLKMWKELPLLLPKRPDRKAKHHLSCPYGEAAILMEMLRKSNVSNSLRLCFEFTVLTAARSGEARGALKSEINLVDKIWVIPDARMKQNVAHIVPLSSRALDILKMAFDLAPDSLFVFPNLSSDKMFSDQAFTKVILRETLGVSHTAHGFRSTFRTWAGEQTKYPREVCEQALAHNIIEAVEGAYLRTTFVEQRRHLMQDWADFLSSTEETAMSIDLKETSSVFRKE